MKKLERFKVNFKPKAKRLNLGGVHIKVDGYDTPFEYNPKIISENLFDLMVNNNCDHQVISHLIYKLEIISSNCIYRKFHKPAITSNANIINHLISLRISSKKKVSKTFSEGEASYIDRILLNKIDHNDQNLAQLFQCTVEEIIKFKEHTIKINSIIHRFKFVKLINNSKVKISKNFNSSINLNSYEHSIVYKLFSIYYVCL